MSRKEIILANVVDLVSDFLYCDRKEDEDLPLGSVQEALQKKEIGLEDIVGQFVISLVKELEA